MTHYIIVKGSTTAHCCFEATVLDTTQRSACYDNYFKNIAECLDIDDAREIARALNGGTPADEFDEEPTATNKAG